MAAIDTVHNQIQAARERRSGHADGRQAVTRSEAIAIVRHAADDGVSPADIREAFRQAGDNGFGQPMEAYLREFEVMRIIGTEPPTRAPLPAPPKLDVSAKTYQSTYGVLAVTPHQRASSAAGDAVTLELISSNPYPHSSGPGETPEIYGRDGLFDQTLLRLYSYNPADPLSAEDEDHAATLARDADIARARRAFLQAGTNSIEVQIPRQPKVD
ncbi:MAG: hypothetical protein Tsb0020_17920 [Haliangiales bacterium]